jgi:hypothetical protein
MHIICQWQVWGSDMYPEFAPEPILQASCSEVATTRVIGHDFFDVDVFVCDAHVAGMMDGLLDGEAEPIEASYAHGYGVAEALANDVELSFDAAQLICYSPDDEWPAGLAPDPDPWIDGIEISAVGAAQFSVGFARGWAERLGERANDVMRDEHRV